MDELRGLIDSLKVLARQANAEEVALLKAVELINAHVEGIRSAVSEAAKLAPANQQKFWTDVAEFLSRRLPD